MDCAPTIPALEKADSIAIAELSPSIEDQKQRYLRGVVVLLWPYSSSTERFKILVSEPDFRLRSSHGQIPVTFRGPTAEKVAKSQIGIGDTVLLSLDGAEWGKKSEEVQSFTGETDWSLAFTDRVALQIYRQAKVFGTVDIDFESQEEDHAIRRTPQASNAVELVSGSPPIQRSPTASRKIDSPFRLNNSSAFDYAEERDEYVSGFGRKRTKFGRPSSEWVFLEGPPSPVRESGDWGIDEFDIEVDGKEGQPGTVEQVNKGALSPISVQVTAVDQGETDTSEGFGTLLTENHHGSLELSELDSANILHSTTRDVEQHENPVAKEPTDSEVRWDIPLAHVSDDQRRPSPKIFPEKSLPPEFTGDVVSSEVRERGVLDPIISPYTGGTESPILTCEIEGHSTSEYPSKAFNAEVEACGSQGGDAESPRSEDTRYEGDQSFERTNLLGSFTRPVPASLQEFESEHETPIPDTASIWSEQEEGERVAPDEPEAGMSEANLGLREEWAANEERNESEASGEQNYYLTTDVSEGDRDSSSGYSINESLIEERIPEMDEQVEDRAEEEMDLEFLPDTFTSSSTGNRMQPAPESSSQPEVIVIDSDEESPREPSHQNVLISHARDNAGSVGLPQGASHGEDSRLGLSGANASSDEGLSDVASRGHQGRSRSRQKSCIWLDGSVEHEIVQEASNFETTSGQPTPSSPSRFRPTATTPDHTTTPNKCLPIHSLSIPYRTAPSRPQRSRWRKTLHTDSAMITPAGTQETVDHQSQELALPSTTTQPPTPQSSRQSQSVPSTAETSEVEMSLDDADKGEFWGRDTPKGTHSLEKSVSPPPHLARSAALLPLSTEALQEMDEETKDSNMETRDEKSVGSVVSPSATPKQPPRAVEPQHDERPQLSWPIAGLRTRLAYFCPFSLLSENFNSAVDTISVVASATPVLRGTRKPRDYFTTLYLMDPSTAGNTICAQLFRKNKDSLPIASKGDVILLRNFKVRSIDHQPMLCTMGHSSWAVFIQGNEEDVQIKGPPVEYEDNERACVAELRQWYVEEGAELAEKHELSNKHSSGSSASEIGSAVRPQYAKNIFRKYQRGRKSSERRLTVHHLRHGRRYTDMSSSDRESIHQLRDGTVYAHF